MSLAAGIVALLVAIAPFVIAILSRRWKLSTTPQAEHENRIAEDDAALTEGAAGLDHLNARFAEYDRRLPDAPGGGDPGGSGGGVRTGREPVDRHQ